jgi:recombination protein RecA
MKTKKSNSAPKETDGLDLEKALVKQLNKVRPEEGMWDVCLTDEEALSAVEYVLTTGIEPFDRIVGGMPIGRIVEIFGLEGCGKTAMSIRLAARAKQKRICKIVRNSTDGSITEFTPVDPDKTDTLCLYIDNEGSLDNDGKLIFDGKPLRIANFRCDTTENMFKAIDNTLNLAEHYAQIHPDRLLFTVIVVDTIASTVTEKEMQAKWDTQDFPRAPQQVSRGLAKLVRKINTLNACLICTNQVRTLFKLGGPSGRPTYGISPKDYSSKGGIALRYYASHRVFMWSLDSKYKLLPDSKFASGLQIGFYTVKNRIKVPMREGRMALLFDQVKGGFNNEWSILETLIGLDFITTNTKGTKYTLEFKKHGIVPTTFGSLQTSLDDDDDDDDASNDKVLPKRKLKDPSFRYRADWPAFAEEHKADIDLLWEKAVESTTKIDGINGKIIQETGFDNGDSDDIDDSDDSDNPNSINND